MSTAVAESLTAMERSDLLHHESTIEHGLQTFVEVGEALAKIRDAKLYKEDHLTFEAYLSERWGLSKARGYQLIEASDSVREMSTIVDAPLPTSEGQARELSGLPADEAADVMRKAHEATDGKVTAKAIKEARQPEPEPEPEPDDVIDAEVIEDDEPVHVNRETGEVTDEPPTCETEATPEEAYRDPDDPFGWEHTYKSFQELGKYLKKNPSPEQRERLARGLMKLHKEITA